MPEVLHGVASWPGALSVESCSYTLSHGISPGSALLRVLPQEALPAETGNLVITDGAESITIPDCKIDVVRVDQDGSGRTWSLSILDRRWKWRDLGQISGAYNQLDPHGKLIPWTIRSPQELAELCLDAMGEQGYTIDLPPGLTEADGFFFRIKNPPWIGVIPVTGTNPPVNWDHEPPAQALANLCELFGRRVIYRLATNTVLIAIPGRGAELPDGSLARESPALDSPETPTGVTVVGSPTRYQVRLLLEAVGEEWDGTYRRLDDLSYAPRGAGKVQISEAHAVASGSSNTYQVFIGAAPGDPPTTGVMFEETGTSAVTVTANLAAAINASTDPRIAGKMTASAGAGVLDVTGRVIGESFVFWSRLSGAVTGIASFACNLLQAAERGAPTWEHCLPPDFADVVATERLTYLEAQALARKSVYKCYRLADVGANGNGPIIVPGYGVINRRQQIVLEDTQVEQVEPQPLDENLVDGGPEGRPIVVNFYNGYSRDKPAACFGSVSAPRSNNAHFAWWVPNEGLPNTVRSSQIFVNFSIDPEAQVVTFGNYVYKDNGGPFLPATPILQTGVLVRDASTNELVCYQTSQVLPGMKGITNFAVRKYPDVQLNVIGEYNKVDKPTGHRLLEADAIMRAGYYLQGLAAQYLAVGGLTREYNGIRGIDCDGAVSQVTWEVGPSGASTTASRNSEHSVYVPPFPARRRAEFLGAAQARQRPDKNAARLDSEMYRPGGG